MCSQRSRSASRERPRKRSKLKMVLGGVLILMVLGTGTVFYLLTARPSGAPQPEYFASPVQRDMVARNLEYRVRTFQQSAAQRRPSALEVSQREVNAYVQSSPDIRRKLQESNVSDLAVSFSKDTVAASAEVVYHGMKVPVTVTGITGTNPDGTMSLQVRTVKTGRFNAPQALTSEIASQVDQAVRNGSLGLPPGVTSVQVEDGKLIVTASPTGVQ